MFDPTSCSSILASEVGPTIPGGGAAPAGGERGLTFRGTFRPAWLGLKCEIELELFIWDLRHLI